MIDTSSYRHWRELIDRAAVVDLHRRAATAGGGRQARRGSLSVRAVARFDYDYPDAELAELAGRIRKLAARTDLAMIVFNNNQEDQGQRNATALMRMLDLHW